jgi:hypothetical protein
MYLQSPSLLDPMGSLWYGLSYLFVELPFSFLRIFVKMVGNLLNLLDLTSVLSDLQATFIENSKYVFLQFTGGRYGLIGTTSLAFLFIGCAALYLFWDFGSRKRNFSRSVVSLIAVLGLGFFYYGNVNGTSQSGGAFIFSTVQSLSSSMKEGLIQGISPQTQVNNNFLTNGEVQKNFGKYLEDYIVKTTANFINSGTADGKIGASSVVLDYKELDSENSQSYIDSIIEDNPYLEAKPELIGEKMMMVGIETLNTLLFIFPIAVINLTITTAQFILLVLILLFPLVLLFSILPQFRNSILVLIKKMFGLLATPVLFSVLIGFFFYLNTIVDSLLLKHFSKILGITAITGISSLGGLNLLTFFLALFLIKLAIFYFGMWKNKGKLLEILTGGQISNEAIRGLDKVERRSQEVATSGGKMVIGGAEAAIGAYTGNPEMMAHGANTTLSGASMVARGQSKNKNHFSTKQVEEDSEIPKEESTNTRNHVEKVAEKSNKIEDLPINEKNETVQNQSLEQEEDLNEPVLNDDYKKMQSNDMFVAPIDENNQTEDFDEVSNEGNNKFEKETFQNTGDWISNIDTINEIREVNE